MRPAVGVEHTGLGQGPGMPPICLDLSGPGGVHGDEVGVVDDDFVAQLLETAGHPLAGGGGLEEDPHPRAISVMDERIMLVPVTRDGQDRVHFDGNVLAQAIFNPRAGDSAGKYGRCPVCSLLRASGRRNR